MLGSSFPEEPALLRLGALGAAASPTTSSLGRVMLTSLGALPEAHDGLAEMEPEGHHGLCPAFSLATAEPGAVQGKYAEMSISAASTKNGGISHGHLFRYILILSKSCLSHSTLNRFEGYYP